MVAVIEHQIVCRLAESLDRDPYELDVELRSADLDLPVDSDDVKPILDSLEADFGVSLPKDSARLSYVRDLAMLIQMQMIGRDA